MGACPSQSMGAGPRPDPPSRISKKGFVAGCIMKTAGTGESCCLPLPRPSRSSLLGEKLLTSVLHCADSSVPLRVVIVGGGPVGLALALRLAEFPGRPASITIFDRRWFKGVDGKFYWSDMQPGNIGRRLPRDQVVTLRDEAVDLFKDGSQATYTLFDGTAVWPGSRSISVSDLEEKMLARVQEADVNKNITLRLVPYEISDILAGRDQRRLPDTSLATYRDWIEARLLGGDEVGAALEEQTGIIVAADGADSLTRKAFQYDFEWTTAGGGSCKTETPRHVTDFAKAVSASGHKAGVAIDTDYLLGVAFEDDKASSAYHRLLSAALSAAQSRFLYSPDAHNGRGYLNIRLHKKEIMSLSQAVGPHVFRPGADRPYWYGMAEITRLFEQLPWLGQIVRDGAEMFDVKDKPIKSIVASYHAPGSAKVFHCVQPNGGVKVCLVGDAAMVHHWFPGRGLEAGLKAADALARILHKGVPLCAYESFMKQLRDHEIRGRSQVMLSQAYILPDCTVQPAREACTDKDEVARFAERVKRLRDYLQGLADEDMPEENLPLSDEDIDKRLSDGVPASLPVGSGGWPPGMLRSLEVMPTGAFASSLNAWAELVAGRPEQAQIACEEALNAEPGDALSLAMMAAVKLHLGRLEEVADEELLTIEGGVDALHHSIIAEAKIHLGRFKDALEDCDKALKCETGNPLAFTVRAEANLRLGRFVEASEDCASAILSSPGTASAYAVRAQAKLHMNRWEETVVDCDCALSQWASANVLAIRGDANRRLGKLQVAISDCDKALKIKPNLVYALSVRGEAHLDLGELSNAVADLDKALTFARGDPTCTLTPDTTEASSGSSTPPRTVSTLTARADAMVRLGRHDEAITNCNEVLKIERKNSLAYAIRAEAKLRGADYDGCILDCNSALRLQPQDAFTYVVRAEAKLHSTRLEDALNDCDEALTIWPSLDYATMVRDRVEQARICGAC